MAEVVLENLHKSFDGMTAVDSMNLTIADGELVVFVGPSGCGKSTTLRMVAGLEVATSGRILFDGRDVTRLEPKDRNVAMVFQHYALYPHKSVFQNLAFGLKMRKTPAAEINKRVEWAAEMLGIAHLMDRKPKQLSGGQMQRVALGRALVREPDVFVLDEPLSNLDAKLRVKMRDEIARLHARLGKSMVHVTHDQVEAMTLGNRVVVMRDGHVQQIGAPLDIYDQPANLFVAGFMGSPEINLIEGEIDRTQATPRFAAGNMTIALSESLAEQLPADQELIFGIRPEHIEYGIAPDQGNEAQITLVEQMGVSTMAVCAIGGKELRVLAGRDDSARIGETRYISLHANRGHFFDKATGQTLVNPSDM